MSFLIRVGGRVLLFLSTRHRVIGVRDWLASLVSLMLLVCFGIAQWAISLGIFSGPMAGIAWDRWLLLAAGVATLSLVAFPAAAYVVKLRRNGITDADYSVSSGIDYKAALESGGAGFDFLGMGAAKLRHHENEFRDAVRATVSSGKNIRMLLTDPQSPAVKRLEGHDNAIGYAETIDGSVKFIRKFAEKSPKQISVKLYRAEDDSDFKPFRLFFANGDCLVSPFVKGTGVDNRGRYLPQLRITERGWPDRNSSTLYNSFERYFEYAWASGATPKEGE